MTHLPKRIIPDREIFALVVEAGFKSDSITMTAIILGESGGNTNAHNPIPPDNSWGLAQINMIDTRGMGTERRAKYGLKSNEELTNPRTNLRVAYDLYRGRGGKFTDWSVYLSGKYLLYMPRARAAARGFSPALIGQVAGKYGKDFQSELFPWEKGILDASENIGDLVTNPLDALSFFTNPGNWLRVAAFVSGGLLLLVGLFGLLAASKPARNLTAMVPAGKSVAKVARAVA